MSIGMAVVSFGQSLSSLLSSIAIAITGGGALALVGAFFLGVSDKVLCLRMPLRNPSWSLGLPACFCFIDFGMVTGVLCQRRKKDVR
jgi:hypothetical protein